MDLAFVLARLYSVRACSMIEIELADTIIRICDLAGYLNLDLGDAIEEKRHPMRADHRPENSF